MRISAAIAEADAEALAAALAAEGRATVQLDGAPVEVLPEEVIVSERPREGWSVVNEQGETVALDLEITPELRRAGLAREVIRTIQEARKGGGFEVSDRITPLYLGRVAADVAAKDVTTSQIIELITTGRTGDIGLPRAVAEVSA